jgi:hypothetical protein
MYHVVMFLVVASLAWRPIANDVRQSALVKYAIDDERRDRIIPRVMTEHHPYCDKCERRDARQNAHKAAGTYMQSHAGALRRCVYATAAVSSTRIRKGAGSSGRMPESNERDPCWKYGGRTAPINVLSMACHGRNGWGGSQPDCRHRDTLLGKLASLLIQEDRLHLTSEGCRDASGRGDSRCRR